MGPHDIDNAFEITARQLRAECLKELDRGLWRVELAADPWRFILPWLPVALTMLAALVGIALLLSAATQTL